MIGDSMPTLLVGSKRFLMYTHIPLFAIVSERFYPYEIVYKEPEPSHLFKN